MKTTNQNVIAARSEVMSRLGLQLSDSKKRTLGRVTHNAWAWIAEHPVQAVEIGLTAASGIAALTELLLADKNQSDVCMLTNSQTHPVLRQMSPRALKRARARLMDANVPGYNLMTGGWANVAGRLAFVPPGVGTNDTLLIKNNPVSYWNAYQARVKEIGPYAASIAALGVVRQLGIYAAAQVLDPAGFIPLAPDIGVAGYVSRPPMTYFTFDKSVRRKIDRGSVEHVFENVRFDHRRLGYVHNDSALHDSCSNYENDIFTRSDSTPPRVIFKSGWLDVRTEPMSLSDYGMVDVANRPFRITINSRMVPSRQEASLVHELLHVVNSLWKLNLDHNQVHDFGLFLTSDIIPAVMALNTNNKQRK